MKKIVSLLLVLVLALGMSTMAFAKATEVRINDVAGGEFAVGDWTPQKGLNRSGASMDTNWHQGDEWELFIPFTWKSDKIADKLVTATSGIKSQVSNDKITFKTSLRSGSKVYDSISVAEKSFAGYAKQAYIKIKMVEYYVSTGDVDFEIRIIPYIDGSRQSEEFTITGNYANEEDDTLDSDTDWFDMSDGYVATATEYIKLVECELGEGVIVWTKMFKDKSYYGVAIRDDDEKDDVIYTKYPDIDSVITMKTVGLSSTAQYVTFQDYDDTFYVYGADFKYLGKSNEKVAFSSKYYLANKMLDVDEEGDEEPYDDEEYDDEIPEAGPITGGDGYPENVNDNPGTGK